jgi:hypothetical protein
VIVSSGTNSKDTANIDDLIEQFGLRALDGGEARAPRPSQRYGLFRLDAVNGQR